VDLFFTGLFMDLFFYGLFFLFFFCLTPLISLIISTLRREMTLGISDPDSEFSELEFSKLDDEEPSGEPSGDSCVAPSAALSV